jgi:hypothetical protein
MPQLDFDGANSKVSADKIQGQSGTSVTVPTGHTLAGTDANSITINGVNAVAVAPSTSGNVLTSNGSAWASQASAGGGKLVQQVTNHTNAIVTGTTSLPQDTTIPQNTEGNALFELAITPESATNRLRIVVLVQAVTAADGQILGIALFQDSTADALNCGWGFNHSGNQNITLHMDYEMAAGTTSATTFKVRGGRSPAGTFHMNRSLYLWMGSPPRMYSSITIQEIAV